MRLINKSSSTFGIIAIILLVSVPLLGQDGYQEYLQQEQRKFQQYVDETDRAFLDFLKKDWKQMEMLDGFVRDEAPKPVEVPVAVDAPEAPPVKPDGTRIPTIPLPELDPQDEFPVDLELPDPELPSSVTVPVPFYGGVIRFERPEELELPAVSSLTQQAMVDYWDAISKQQTAQVIEQLQYLKKEMRLNDWAFANLAYQLATTLSGKQDRSATLATWYILVKSGYDVRAGYNAEEVFLLAATDRVLYGVSYFEYDKKPYYVISFDGKSRQVPTLFSYEGKFDQAQSVISLLLEQSPVLEPQWEERQLKFEYAGQEFHVNAVYNRNKVDFLNAYPLTELEVYFGAAVTPRTRRSLLEGLKPIVENKSEAEAVDMILRFVQTAFEYQIDNDQFGREKYFFAEETVFYPYCDCEDRSVLFSYLVRNLTGLKVIGVNYPGHVAAAVNFSQVQSGTNVNVNGQPYLICDPTYINATIGMEMPNLNISQRKIISLPENSGVSR